MGSRKGGKDLRASPESVGHELKIHNSRSDLDLVIDFLHCPVAGSPKSRNDPNIGPVACRKWYSIKARSTPG